jgi:lysophospholipase L1-like esterase
MRLRSSRIVNRLRGLVFTLLALGAAACGSPTTPTPAPPPSDPPKITCSPDVTVTSPTGGPVTVTYGAATTQAGQAPVTVACTPASGTQFAIGQSTVTCTATDALKRTDTCTLTVKVQPPPMLTVTRFLAYGDSITWGEDGTNLTVSSAGTIRPRLQYPANETYPGVLQQELVSRYQLQSPRVYNGGQPGQALTTTTGAPDPSTLATYTNLTSSRQWDVVLIMEGSNDVTKQDDKIFPAAISVLRQMIGDAQSRQMIPFLATIPPMNPSGCCPDRGRAAALVPEFNDDVRALAASQNVTLVDVYAALAPDVPTYIGPDGLHPTLAGYAKIADTFFGAIEQTLEQTQNPTATPASFRPPFVLPFPRR